MYKILQEDKVDSKKVLDLDTCSLTDITTTTDTPTTSKTDDASSISLKYTIIIASIFIVNYFLSSYVILLNYKNNLIKSDAFWLSLANRTTNCRNASQYNQARLEELKLFVDFLNQQKDLNYFMCFSSLYYAAKVQRYDVFRADLEHSSFSIKNRFYKIKSGDKCVLEEAHLHYDDDDDDPRFSFLFNLHLCFLGNELDSDNLCSLVEKYPGKRVTCYYDYISGEYSIDLNKDVKLMFHEYQVGLKTWSYLYNIIFKAKSNESLEEDGYLDEKARLNMGLIGMLFGNDYFNMPRYFFYNRMIGGGEKREFLFLNYLTSAFRMPSEIVNYFMVFYSKIWYIY